LTKLSTSLNENQLFMKNDTLKFGLIYGIVSILIMGLVSVIDPKAMMKFSHWSTILGFAAAIGLMYYAAKTARDKKGGFIPFGEALVPSLGTFAIGSLISVLFMYLLVNHINPDLIPIMEEGAKEMQEGMFDMMGLTEEQKLQAMEEAERQQAGTNPFGLGALLIGWVTNLFFMGLPIAAIIAAIVKKNEPMPVV